MKNKKLIISLLFIIGLIILFFVVRSKYTTTYHLDYKDIIDIEIKATPDFGYLQAAGYNVKMTIINKKTNQKVKTKFKDDRLGFDFHVSDMLINGEKKKLIVYYNQVYPDYKIFDYYTLEEIVLDNYSGRWWHEKGGAIIELSMDEERIDPIGKL